MKKILFRAWNKKYKKMVYKGIIDYWLKHQIIETPLGETYEVMQYTGLKDKNGKKIFEGDIIDEYWISKYSKFVVNEWYRTLWHQYQHSGETWEVIGNLYEDSHLLDKE